MTELAPIPKQPESSGLGTAGLVCGTLGVILGLAVTIGLGFLLSLLGIIFGAVGKSRAGLVLGIIGTTLVPILGIAAAMNH